MFASFALDTQRISEIQQLDTEVLGPICPADISCGYAYIDNDVCVSTVAVIGQYIRKLQETDSTPEAVLSAALCHDCRSNDLDLLMRSALDRAGFPNVRIIALIDDDLSIAIKEPAITPNSGRPEERPLRIGVFGPIPVIVTEEFNRTVVERLKANGLEVVLPPIAQLLGQRDVFEPALQFFAGEGITYAIGVIPFGCMSGHVFARGRLRTFQRLYPDLQITLIDYDPSASDINTVNRTELVIQSILE